MWLWVGGKQGQAGGQAIVIHTRMPVLLLKVFNVSWVACLALWCRGQGSTHRGFCPSEWQSLKASRPHLALGKPSAPRQEHAHDIDFLLSGPSTVLLIEWLLHPLPLPLSLHTLSWWLVLHLSSSLSLAFSHSQCQFLLNFPSVFCLCSLVSHWLYTPSPNVHCHTKEEISRNLERVPKTLLM